MNGFVDVCVSLVKKIVIVTVCLVVVATIFGKDTSKSGQTQAASAENAGASTTEPIALQRSQHDLKLDSLVYHNHANGIESTWGLIEVGEVKIVSNEYGSQRIEGTVENDSGNELGYVQVIYRIEDSHHNQVDTEMANTLHLAAGARWHYSVPVSYEHQYYWQIVEMSGR